MAFFTTENGQTRTELSIPAVYEGYPGVIHGGIVAAILDEVGGRSQMEAFTRFMVTAQLNVRYRKPVPSKTPLVVIGNAGERKGRVAYAQSEIQAVDGEVLADAELVLVDIPEEQLREFDLEALGWKVYPDEEAG